MLTGHVGPFIRPNGRTSTRRRVLASLQARAARRVGAEGFPVDPKPMTKEEIETYLGGDRITCLQCGRSMRSLGVHLRQIHSMTVDDYKTMYGLPWSRGLESASSSEARRSASVEMIARTGAPWLVRCQTGDSRLTDAPRRKRQPFRREVCLMNVSTVEHTEVDIEPAIEAVLKGISEGRHIRHMLGKDGVPAKTTWLTWLKTRAGLRERVMEAVWAMPAAYQAAAQLGIGPAVWDEVRRLRAQGLSDHKIAPLLGVTSMTINNGRRARGIP